MSREAKAFAMALGMMMDNDARFIMAPTKEVVMEWIKTLNWKNTADKKPPQNKRVLAYGKSIGFMVVEYHFHPAWEPFDEAGHAGLPDDLRNSMRWLNEYRRGEEAAEGWACACEDSYWDIDKFTQWCELPDIL